MPWEYCYIMRRLGVNGEPTGAMEVRYLGRPTTDACEPVEDLDSTIAALGRHNWEMVGIVPVFAGFEATGMRKVLETIFFKRPSTEIPRGADSD